ncbi:MAG: hypothetical protein K8R99_02870 [Actinomycetia bacterium]|nr:hypothetical protein [Actinomycetes bacterium]
MVTALAAVAVGCGGDDKSGGSGSSSEATRSVLGLLGVVADNEANRSQPIVYGNLERARGGDNPGSFEDDVALLMEGTSNSLSLPRAISGGILEPEFAEFTGFDTREIEAFLDFGSQPDQVTALVGSFDAGDLESGLRSSPGGDALEEESIDGVTYMSLGADDDVDFGAVSAVRRLGEPLRIAVDGDLLYWSRGRALVDACIAAASDAGPSLADDAAYAAVAGVLDAASVVTAELVPPWGGEGWAFAGLGEAFSGETSTLTIALSYSDAAAASAAVAAFRTQVESGVSLAGSPWSEVLTATDIHAEGSLMIATLTSLNPGISHDLFLRQENLLQF